MPQRADRKDIGTSLGKMMFHGEQAPKRIARRINTPAFREALERRGVGDVSVEKVAKTLAGKDRAGLTTREMKKVVAAMQDADLAAHARSASQMVLTAARDAQENMPAFKTPEERAAFMKRLALERRKEANLEMNAAEQGERGTQGLLERMRAQMRGRALKENNNNETSSVADHSPRERLPLAPKPILPKPPEGNSAGFQV